MKSNTIKYKRHYVYETLEEFYLHYDKDTPIVKGWRTAKEGDWVYSDDGNIVQILKAKSMSHPGDTKNYKLTNGYVRTIVGTFLNTPKTFMDTDFDKHPNRYTFSTNPDLVTGSQRMKKRTKCTQREKLFATQVAVGTDAVSAYMQTFKEDNAQKARKKAVILLKQERVMSEVEKSAKDIAKQLGIDHAYILGSLKQLADTSEDQNIALQSLKELGKAIGTLGNQVKRIDTGVVGLFQGFSPDQIESAQRKALPDAFEDEVEPQEETDDMSTL